MILSFPFALSAAGNNYLHTPRAVIDQGSPQPDGRVLAHPDKRVIEDKIGEKGFRVGIRLLANTNVHLHGLAGAFGVYTRTGANHLTISSPSFWQRKKLLGAVTTRSMALVPKRQYLNVSEIASLWHLPGPMTTVPNIAWGKTILAELPENLPVAQALPPEEKSQINFFAKAEFKNQTQTFGIKKADRRRHM